MPPLRDGLPTDAALALLATVAESTDWEGPGQPEPPAAV